MQRRTARIGACLVALLATASLVGCAPDDSRTTITFFQFKPEAVTYFQGLASEFEKQNPDIHVVVQNVPDPETALRTRLVKNDVPDVMTLNGNGTFGELASAGIFADFAHQPVLDDVKPGYVDVLKNLGAAKPGEVNGIPFAANASGVLYNEKIFAEHDVLVPRTFDELVAAAKTFKKAGVTPFYGMLKDAWTAQSPLAPLTAQTTPANFFPERFADKATFGNGWRTAADELSTLYDYTQPDPAAFGYEEGTRAFAQGDSAMLLLGSYAVPQIRTFKPKFTVGSFALPATNDPKKTTLVSGIDVLLTASAKGAHPKESQRFIDFLMAPDVVQKYAEDQVAIPVLKDQKNTDPALAGVQKYLDEERIVGFTDHQFIPAIPLAALLQQFLVDRDTGKFLGALDETWDQVAKRRTWGLGAVAS